MVGALRCVACRKLSQPLLTRWYYCLRDVTTWFWDTANGTDHGPNFLGWLVGASALPNAQLPRLFSVSWGCFLPEPSWRSRVDMELAALGARGVSMIFAAGDGGDGCDCANRGPLLYPSGSPYVTSVGGTTLVPQQVGTAAWLPNETKPNSHSLALQDGSMSEQFCSVLVGSYYTAGGGFSGFYPRPAYQAAAVAPYLRNTTALPPNGTFAADGRGFPDVAEFGLNSLVVVDGVVTPSGLRTCAACSMCAELHADMLPVVCSGGTSTATPSFAGLVSLLNRLRLNAGKPPLGFLNKLL